MIRQIITQKEEDSDRHICKISPKIKEKYYIKYKDTDLLCCQLFNQAMKLFFQQFFPLSCTQWGKYILVLKLHFAHVIGMQLILGDLKERETRKRTKRQMWSFQLAKHQFNNLKPKSDSEIFHLVIIFQVISVWPMFFPSILE